MTAQFTGSLTVLRLLPTSERLRRPHRQSGIGAERIQQAVRRQSRHIAAIPFLRIEVHIVRKQSNLTHWERLHPRRNVLTSELQRPFECRRIRHKRSPERPRSQTCRGGIRPLNFLAN